MEIEVKEIQKILLRMLKDFHDFCQNRNIRYYMIGGTCLGARRHKGFIPWDDDCDIGVPRDDYNRLCNFSNEELPDGYEFRYYKTDSTSPIHYIKMIKSNTTLIENGYRNYVEGVYIDIFPLDGVKDISFLERLRWNQIWFLHSIIINYSTTNKKNTILKRAFLLWCKKQNIKKVHDKLEKLMTKYNYDDCSKVCNFLGSYREKEIFDKRILGTPKKYKFAQYDFFGPEFIDEFLTNTYGNYMKLPPKDEQIGKHNYYYVNLQKSYKDYIKERKKCD